jgi:hypothetical protein
MKTRSILVITSFIFGCLVLIDAEKQNNVEISDEKLLVSVIFGLSRKKLKAVFLYKKDKKSNM